MDVETGQLARCPQQEEAPYASKYPSRELPHPCKEGASDSDPLVLEGRAGEGWGEQWASLAALRPGLTWGSRDPQGPESPRGNLSPCLWGSPDPALWLEPTLYLHLLRTALLFWETFLQPHSSEGCQKQYLTLDIMTGPEAGILPGQDKQE